MGGQGYVSAAREAAFSGPGKFWGVMRKAPKGGELDPIDADINRIIAMVRARAEHPLRVLKRQFGYLNALKDSFASVRDAFGGKSMSYKDTLSGLMADSIRSSRKAPAARVPEIRIFYRGQGALGMRGADYPNFKDEV